MGIFDKAKDVLAQHPDKVEQALDKAAGLADQRTGGQHADRIDQGVDAAKQKLADLRRNDPAPPPA